MAFGYIGFSSPPLTVGRPSPSLWADCLHTILNDKALGVFMAQDFIGVYTNPSGTTLAQGIETYAGTGTNVFGQASTATFGPHALSQATGATAQNNNAVFFEELGFASANPASGTPGTIVKNSGNKVWFETSMAPTALGQAAIFMGLATRAGVNNAGAGIIADTPSTSAQATLNNFSAVGFVTKMTASALISVDAVYKKGSTAQVTVLANVGAATAFTGSSTTSNSALFPGGIPTGLTAPGNLAASTYQNYGVRFDGLQTIEYYVNGVLVAKQTVDSTVDQAVLYCPVVAVKTGANVAQVVNLEFVRAAFQDRF